MSELSKEARALLEAARAAEDPRPADRARVLAALSARLALPALPDPSAGAGASAAGSGAAAGTGAAAAVKPGAGLTAAAKVKIVVAVVVVSAGGAGTYKLIDSGRTTDEDRQLAAVTAAAKVEPREVTSRSVAASPAKASAEPRTVEPKTAEPQTGRRARLATAVPPSPPSPIVRPAPKIARRAVTVDAAPDEPGAPGGAPAPAVGDPAEPVPTGPGVTAATVLRPAPAPALVKAPSPSTPPPRPRCDTSAELALLKDAQASLRARDGERALAALGRHARRCSAPTFGEEARAARVLALCLVGRVADARREADRLRRESPRSLHLARLRSSCARAKRTKP